MCEFFWSKIQVFQVHGCYIEFDEKTSNLINPAYTKRPLVNFDTLAGYPDEPVARLKSFFKLPNFLMLNHAVLRRSAWEAAMERYKNIKYETLTAFKYADFMQALCILAHGNIKFFDEIYSLRSAERLISNTQLDHFLAPEKTFEKNYFADTFSSKHPVSEHLSEKLSITSSQATLLHGFLIGQFIESRKPAENTFQKLSDLYKLRKVKLKRITPKNKQEIGACIKLIRKHNKITISFLQSTKNLLRSWIYKLIYRFDVDI